MNAPLIFYHYAKCATCVKAKKYLAGQGYRLREIDVTTDPPTAAVLTDLIQKSGRPYTDFLNRSGEQYRVLNMKEKVARLSEVEVIAMLAQNGRLIKRPIVSDGTRVTVGFNAESDPRVWPGA